MYFSSQKPLTWLEMVHVPEKISAFGCYKNGWTCPDVNVKSFVSVAKDSAGDDLTSCGNIRFCHHKHSWKCSALLKYTRRCHAYRRCSEYFDYSRPLSSHILCLGVKRLVTSMLPPLVGSGSQAWATECMLTINFKVCTYSGLLCCWLEVLLLLFWFTVPTETSTFVHNNVQVMKVAPSKSVSGKSQRHWHCLSIYGDTELHDNQQR